MQEHYQEMMKAKQTLLARLKEQRSTMGHNINLFNTACVDGIQGIDGEISSNPDPTGVSRLREYRTNMGAHLNLMNGKSVEAIRNQDAVIACEGEALHHLFGMMQGRPLAPVQAAPQAAPPIAGTVVPEQGPPARAETIVPEQGPPAPGMTSQVSEVITADGVKTTFENGVAVAQTQVPVQAPPIAQAPPNGSVG